MAKTGRPRKEIDFDEFEKLCLLQCSLMEICEWFRINNKCLETRVKEHYGQSFAEVFAKKRVGGLISLRRNLFKMAEHNVAAAIFLAKNHLGMKDVQEVEHSGNIGIRPEELSDAELAAIVAGNGRRGTIKAPGGPVSVN